MAHTLIKHKASMPFITFVSPARGFVNSFALKSKKVPEEALPKSIYQDFYTAHKQPPGDIYDKRPFRIKLTANKKYMWCSCGHSKSQPLCDGTHRIFTLGIKNKPVMFAVAETKEYWLCNCKQSRHRPFCDGTHLSQEIQSKLKHFKN